MALQQGSDFVDQAFASGVIAASGDPLAGGLQGGQAAGGLGAGSSSPFGTVASNPLQQILPAATAVAGHSGLLSPGTGSLTVGGWSASNADLTLLGQTNTVTSSPVQVHPLVTVTVTIDVPAANSNVPGGGSFKTFGYVSPTTATMTAWVTDANNNTYNGTAFPPIPHSPRYQWGFSFTGIPTNQQVTLTVQGNSQGNLGSESITITCT